MKIITVAGDRVVILVEGKDTQGKHAISGSDPASAGWTAATRASARG